VEIGRAWDRGIAQPGSARQPLGPARGLD
jgi:hypothetical protein